MGWMQNWGTGLGQAGAPYTSAPTAATGSLAWNSLGTATSAIGDIFSGIGRSQMWGVQAGLAQRGAQAALTGGQVEEEESKLRYGAEVGRETANQAAGNVDVNSASAVRVRDSTKQIGALDAALIHYNAAKEAYGEKVDATMAKRAQTGALIGGIMSAGQTLLSGATSASEKYLAYQLSGASGGYPAIAS